MTNGQYTTRPSGDDNEGRDQTDKLEEADKTKRRGNTTTTAENRGNDTDGAQLQDRPFETPGQARNRVPLSPVSEKYEKTVRRTDMEKTRSQMSPSAMEEARGISERLQALQDEMEALQEEASARRLFDDDEVEELHADEKERQSGEDYDDDDDDDDKGPSSGSDDEENGPRVGGAEDKRKDFT